MSARAPKVMLLIDADNLSPDVIGQAVDTVVREHGALHVRRAYCTAESALKQQGMFKAHAIRPMVNLSAGKNSTDIALAVDALDLAVSERPDVIVIASSDSDFAPLVLRLREKGCRVCGIGQQGKTGDEVVQVYDQFTVLSHRARGRAAGSARAESAPAAAPASARRGSRAAPPAPEPAAAPPARKTRGRRAEAAAAPATPAWPEDVQRILDAVPELQRGQRLALNIVAEKLRAAGLLTKSAPTTRLFKKHADWFALMPDTQPNQVQLRSA
jgi:uncharacterized protein (TIGR00288 family)